MKEIESAILDVHLYSVDIYLDERGGTIELWRGDWPDFGDKILPVMFYHSLTLPGKVRGPHEHTDQTDTFAFVGPGDFRVTLWDGRVKFPLETKEEWILGGSRPCLLVIPPGVIHGYKNISNYSAVALNFPNRLYKGSGKQEKVDEIRHEADKNSPYQIK